MPVLLRHSRHVYSCVPARTHTSMRVLLRHNRHRTGRSRSGASQLQETKQPRAEQPCTQQPGAKQPVPPHRNQKQRHAAVKSTATKHTTRAQQPGTPKHKHKHNQLLVQISEQLSQLGDVRILHVSCRTWGKGCQVLLYCTIIPMVVNHILRFVNIFQSDVMCGHGADGDVVGPVV